MVLGSATGSPRGPPLLILLMICLVQLDVAQEATYVTSVTTGTHPPRATSVTTGTHPPRATSVTTGTHPPRATSVTTWTHPPHEGDSGTTSGVTRSSDTSNSTTGSTADRPSCLQHTDCPPFSSCMDVGGYLICACDIGYYFHSGLGCIVAKTFPAQVTPPPRSQDPDPPNESLAAEHLRNQFQVALGQIDGYLSTAVTHVDAAAGHAVVLHYFSMLSSVTAQDLQDELIRSSLLCTNADSSCVFSADSYHSMSLCDLGMCDPSSTICLFRDGLVSCDCQEGYYQFHPGDRSCAACQSGEFWKDGRCLRCPFGFSGFNCKEPFLLTVVIESCVSCVLLVLLFILIHYQIRRKKPLKPSLMDRVIRGSPSDEHVIRLPRAQFSWRNNWEWEEPPVSQLASAGPDKDPVLGFPEIRMKTFGDSPPAVVSSPPRGSHNLTFISD